MLTITENAAKKIQSFFDAEEGAKGKGLRVGLKASGCAGFEYVMGFDEKRDGDTVIAQGGFEVFVDPNSAPQLTGATIDYREDAMGAGFKISNPKEKSSCGCGKSKQF